MKKFITDFVTSRIHAKFRELSIGDIIDLCNIPVEFNERGITRALEGIVTDTSLPVSEWTAQERYAAMIHYYYNVNFTNLNIVVDEESGATIEDYLITDKDYPVKAPGLLAEPHEQPFLKYEFVLDADSDKPDSLWMLPLTGEWMEAIERVVLGGYIKNTTNKTEVWRIATAAAQILPLNITFNQALEIAGVSIDKYITDNANLILSMSETHYEEVMQAFDAGTQYLDHIVALRECDSGFCLECQKEGGEDGMPSFRFLFNALFNEGARQLWQRDA